MPPAMPGPPVDPDDPTRLTRTHTLRHERRLDPDLFALFLNSGVYRAYGAKFLLPEQIDEVDIARYLGAPSEREAAVA